MALALRCCGGLFATTSTARSKRDHASGLRAIVSRALLGLVVMANPIDALPEIDRVYYLFGKAFASWADVEYALWLWFKQCTGLEWEASQKIFFSGSSFQARLNILYAALETAHLDDAWRQYLNEATAKAMGYSSTRNRLAHGILQPTALDMAGQPKGWIVKEQTKWRSKIGVREHELTVIADNFSGLASILRLSFLSFAAKEQPAKFSRLMHALPSEAYSNQLSRKQKGRERQRRSSRSKS
jgi:hypothetical protein